jgi:hypothetical protein
VISEHHLICGHRHDQLPRRRFSQEASTFQAVEDGDLLALAARGRVGSEANEYLLCGKGNRTSFMSS